MDHDAAEQTPSHQPDAAEQTSGQQPDAAGQTGQQPGSGGAGPRVALIGLGTVGTATAARLLDEDWRAAVSARGHAAPRLVGVADLDLDRDRGLALEGVRQVGDYAELVAADDVDIVIELMGGSDVAGDAVVAALDAGKSVVTANKDLVARRGQELEESARRSGADLRFEAAVMSGTPVLGPLVWELAADRVATLHGIFNGTTNYILSTMAADAREYDEVLTEAKARGYAEADPTSDVEGWDAAYKLAILIRLAWDGWPDVEALRRSAPAFGGQTSPGITGVKRGHLSAAARLGMAIKLISRARRDGDRISGGVTPMAVSSGSVLGRTGEVTNVVEIDAEPVGRVSMTGPGAGGPATSTAILSDLLAVASGGGSTWAHLPPAGSVAVEDDMDTEHGWLVVVEGLGEAGFPETIRELALASTDEGFVTRPMSLSSLGARLGLFEKTVAVYPILEDA